MLDREKVMTWLEICGKNRDCSETCPYGDGSCEFENSNCIEDLMADALALLKDQEAVFSNLVIDWLREIALNNFECNRNMTFLDAVEDIRDRASYGLKQYFIDKQDKR